YLFRRIALDYLPVDKRAELGIFSAAERTVQVSGPNGPDAVADLASTFDLHPSLEIDQDAAPAPEKPDVALEGSAAAAAAATVAASATPSRAGSSTELLEMVIGKSADAPLCFTCGTKMRPSGACYVCEGCGSTSGCS
ncbi:MAG: vitamin B12-dependent ribonucleotide reductase, partial [Nakamurella sp.]